MKDWIGNKNNNHVILACVKKRINNVKRKQSVLLSICILMSWLIISGMVQETQGTSTTYSEDFTTTTYRDPSATNVSGWGTGEINIPHKTPTLISSLKFLMYGLPGNWVEVEAMDLEIVGDYAYVTLFGHEYDSDEIAGALQVVNISNHIAPYVIGSYNTPNVIYGLAIEGDYAYLANDIDGLLVLDITDPHIPVFAGLYNTTSETIRDHVVDVYVEGDYAYVASAGPFDAENRGLHVVNISNPLDPHLTGYYRPIGDSINVIVEGDYAYLLTGPQLEVVDIVDPTNPTFVFSYSPVDLSYSSPTISGDFMYIADRDTGLLVLDISDPRTPIFSGSCDTPGYANGIDVEGNYAYIADYANGLQVLNIANPAIPILVGSLSPQEDNYYEGLKVVGEYCYVIASGMMGGLTIIQISDLTTPTLVGSYINPGQFVGYKKGISVAGDYVYIADAVSGFQTVNITDPTSPELAGSWDGVGISYTFEIEIEGDFAYLAAGDDGLIIVDISDPTTPTYSGEFPPLFGINNGWVYGLDVIGDYVYLTDGYSLVVIDCSNPFNPVLAGSYDSNGNAFDVEVVGNYAYIANEVGLLVLDITNPKVPIFAGLYDTNSVMDVFVEGDYAFILASGVLEVIDITTPTNPTLVADYFPDQWPFRIDIKGDYLYLAEDGFFEIIDIIDPSNPTSFDVIEINGQPSGVVVMGDYAYVRDCINGLQVVEVRWNRVRQFIPQATAQSLPIQTLTSASFISATLFVTDFIPIDTSITYFLSADNGAHWEQINPGLEHLFTYTGSGLKWKAIFNTNYELITPYLSFLTLDYTYFLDVPPLISPIDNFITTDNTPTFNWDALIGVSNYILQIDVSTSFTTSNLINETLGVLNYDSRILTDGIWYWRVAAIDSEGEFGLFSPPQTLLIDTTPPAIDHPGDVVYEQGLLGGSISWHPDDLTPYYYNVTRNAVLIENGPWQGEIITTGIEGLTPGTYSFVCNVYDQTGHSNTDHVYVIVTDSNAPTINHPADLTYQEGDSGNNLTWTPSDTNPASFLIERDGELIVGGPWNGDPITISVDGLTSGTFHYTCTVYDQMGNNATDIVTVIVTSTPDNPVPTIDHPDDFSYQEGDSGNNLTWTPSDTDPASFLIERDGELIVGGPWNGDPITISIDGLSSETYSYTCTVYDQAGGYSFDNVIVIVTKTPVNIAPIIDHPTDITYQESDNGNNLTWSPSDTNPTSFLIDRDGELIVGGPWNGEPIIISIDGLPSGTYSYTCTVYDQAGANTFDSITVIVTKAPDDIAPTIDNPSDISYIEGMTGFNLNWHPLDDHPSSFTITRNGTVVQSGAWDGRSLTISVDGLSPGNYTYICTVFDETGNSVSNTVLVTVIMKITSSSEWGPMFLTFTAITVVVIQKKRRKQHKK